MGVPSRLWGTLLCSVAVGLPAAIGDGGKPAPSATSLFHHAWYTENGQRDLAEAVETYREVIEMAERKGDRSLAARSYVRIGVCLGRLQKKSEAIQAYQKALSLRNVDDRDYDEVIATLERPAANLLDLNELPDVIQKRICEHFYKRAEKLQAEDPSKAIDAFRRAVDVNRAVGETEQAGHVMSSIGDLFRRKGAFGEALQTYREVLEEFPEEYSVLAWNHIRIAETYRLIDQPGAAIAAYSMIEDQKFIRQVQQRLWAKLWTGDAYRAKDEIEAARRAWRAMLTSAQNPPLPEQLAAMLLDKGEIPATQEPESLFANDLAYFVAVRYEMKNDLDSARQWIEKCIQLSQGHDWPRQLAEKTLARLSLSQSGQVDN